MNQLAQRDADGSPQGASIVVLHTNCHAEGGSLTRREAHDEQQAGEGRIASGSVNLPSSQQQKAPIRAQAATLSAERRNGAQ